MTFPPLTFDDVLALANILRTAQSQAPVARVCDDVPDGVVYGTARGITDGNGVRWRADQDIREACLRVTPESGMTDFYWPIVALIPENKAGMFSEYVRASIG